MISALGTLGEKRTYRRSRSCSPHDEINEYMESIKKRLNEEKNLSIEKYSMNIALHSLVKYDNVHYFDVFIILLY